MAKSTLYVVNGTHREESSTAQDERTEVIEAPRPSLLSQLVTTVRLLAVIGLVGLVLWLLDQWVSS